MYIIIFSWKPFATIPWQVWRLGWDKLEEKNFGLPPFTNEANLTIHQQKVCPSWNQSGGRSFSSLSLMHHVKNWEVMILLSSRTQPQKLLFRRFLRQNVFGRICGQYSTPDQFIKKIMPAVPTWRHSSCHWVPACRIPNSFGVSNEPTSGCAKCAIFPNYPL